VLFAKLNGLKQTVDNVLMQPNKEQQQQTINSGNAPVVFISEGADEDGNIFGENFMNAYEVQNQNNDFEDDVEDLPNPRQLIDDHVHSDEKHNEHLYKHGYRAHYKLPGKK
jgi:hypothetical protein